MNSKNILIINYVFPPYPGIGGRRWAKFAKYLYRYGHNVYVIAAQNPYSNVSTFINDIAEIPKENFYYLPPLYPKIIFSPLKNFIDKLQYQFWYRVLPLFTDGNYYDRSMFWKNQLQKKIVKLIEEKKIDTIIVSGPPFHYAYYTLQLKDIYPNIKFIVDYRDEWTFNGVHGIDSIGERRKQKEIEKEKYVCEKADVVISCASLILEYLNKKYKLKNYFLLSHAYDKDDFNFSFDKKSLSNDKIIITLFGNIEGDQSLFFENLNKFLNVLQNQNKELYQKIFFNFYLLSPNKYLSIIKPHKDKYIVKYNLSSEKLFEEIIESHFILVLLSKRSKDYFTTKFPELFYMKKPLLLWSEKGIIGEFVKKHKIGIHLTKENFNELFLYALSHPEEFQYTNFPIEEWDYEYRTKELEKLL